MTVTNSALFNMVNACELFVSFHCQVPFKKVNTYTIVWIHVLLIFRIKETVFNNYEGIHFLPIMTISVSFFKFRIFYTEKKIHNVKWKKEDQLYS